MQNKRAEVSNWKRPDKSGLQVAPPTYSGLLCREILKANAEAQARVEAKKTGKYYGKVK